MNVLICKRVVYFIYSRHYVHFLSFNAFDAKIVMSITYGIGYVMPSYIHSRGRKAERELLQTSVQREIDALKDPAWIASY